MALPMKRFSLVVSLLLFPALVLATKVEMPEWGDAAEAANYHLGGGLWPTGLLAGTEEESESTDATVAEAGTEKTEKASEAAEGAVTPEQALKFYGPAGEMPEEPITADTVARTNEEAAEPPETAGTTVADATAMESETPENLSEGLKFPDEEPAREEPVEALPPLQGQLAETYFAHAPMDFLVDPQRLLTEQKSNDIKRFLEFHSDESPVHIYVMVFGETQALPEHIDIQELHKEWFSENPTVLMLYYRESPEQTEFVFNEKIRNALPKSVFDRIQQNCLREGSATDDAPDQVEKMAIELSIQLYWLSRLQEHDTTEAQERAAESSIHELPASADAPELLREYAPGIFLEKKGRKVLSIVITALIVLATLVGVASVAWLVMWWRNRDRIAGKPLIFPSFEAVPRLGGQFSGGGFVSMSFELNNGSDFTN